MNDTDDAILIKHARGGDRAALDELLAKYQSRIYSFGMRMCRDPEDAKDVLQDTLLALANGVGDFRGSSSLSTWLFAVARSFCIKKRRRSKFAPARLQSLDDDQGAAQVASAARGPEELVAGRELERALGDAIEALEPKLREVLILRDVEGLSAADVAQVLSISVEAVKSRLHRARLAVRARLAPLLGDDDDAKAPAAPGACPDVMDALLHKLDGDLDAAACAEMEQHVAQCQRCRNKCDGLKRTLTLCQDAGARSAGRVPPAVQAEVQAAVRAALGAATAR